MKDKLILLALYLLYNIVCLQTKESDFLIGMVEKMNYRQIGDTELNISELSFGTWAIGGSWGKSDDAEALKGLERAMDAGVNFFDTADIYGNGHSEELLAKATKGRKIKSLLPQSSVVRVIFLTRKRILIRKLRPIVKQA